jgi:hypothetical protein
MPQRHAAPLYVECFSSRPSVPERAIVDDQNPVRISPGHWQCEAHAPNGVGAVLEIDTATGMVLSRDDIAQRLQLQTSTKDLWVAPPYHSTDQAPFEEVQIGVWADDRMLETSEFTITAANTSERHWRLKVATRAKSIIQYLQVVVTDGSSMIVRCPSEAALLFQCEHLASPLPVRLLFATDDPGVNAYWGFMRHSVSRGAYNLGRQMADRCRAGEAGLSDVVVAAHWATSFGVDDADLIPAITARLDANIEDQDALVLRWIFDFDRNLTGDTERLAKSFWAVLDAVLQKRPLFTGTIKLLAERLSIIGRLLGDEALQDPSGEQRFARLWALASSMAWDTEYTSYRGLRPDQPDPEALSVHLDERAKKKFGGWRPHP